MERARQWGLRVVVAGAIACGLSAPAAAARPSLPAAAVPWVAQYTVDVSGSQTGSWTEHHQPTGVCDAAETGSGNEDVTLNPNGSAPVFASGVGPVLTSIMIAAGSDLPNPGDPLSVPQTLLRASASVSRQGSVTDGPANSDLCPSGDGGGSSPPTPDCGTQVQAVSLWFSQHQSLLHFEQPDGSVPSQPFNDCPYLGPGMDPTWLPTDIPVPLSGWGPPPPIGSAVGHGLPVELHGQASTEQHDADLDGTASQRITLRFVPVYVAPTIVLGDVSTETVGSDGTIGVPVSCPKGERSGCSGSVALTIDVATASAAPTIDVATASAAAPTASAVGAAPASAGTIAKAPFKLRAGARQRLKLRIAHASKSYLRALAQAPTAIAVTVGGRHPIRYVAARTKLRP